MDEQGGYALKFRPRLYLQPGGRLSTQTSQLFIQLHGLAKLKRKLVLQLFTRTAKTAHTAQHIAVMLHACALV